MCLNSITINKARHKHLTNPETKKGANLAKNNAKSAPKSLGRQFKSSPKVVFGKWYLLNCTLKNGTKKPRNHCGFWVFRTDIFFGSKCWVEVPKKMQDLKPFSPDYNKKCFLPWQKATSDTFSLFTIAYYFQKASRTDLVKSE